MDPTKENIIKFYEELLDDLNRAQNYSDLAGLFKVVKDLIEFDLKVVKEIEL